MYRPWSSSFTLLICRNHVRCLSCLSWVTLIRGFRVITWLCTVRMADCSKWIQATCKTQTHWLLNVGMKIENFPKENFSLLFFVQRKNSLKRKSDPITHTKTLSDVTVIYHYQTWICGSWGCELLVHSYANCPFMSFHNVPSDGTGFIRLFVMVFFHCYAVIYAVGRPVSWLEIQMCFRIQITVASHFSSKSKCEMQFFDTTWSAGPKGNGNQREIKHIWYIDKLPFKTVKKTQLFMDQTSNNIIYMSRTGWFEPCMSDERNLKPHLLLNPISLQSLLA